jgi:very-short-patch-repair endonuclease
MREKEDLPRRRALRQQRTEAEHRIWQRLRAHRFDGMKFRRRYQVCPYFLDFYCVQARLAVEVDGSQHLESVAYDDRRTRFLEGHGIRVLRFWNHDVLARTDDVMAAIAEALAGAQVRAG